MPAASLPIIDMAPLLTIGDHAAAAGAAREIAAACRESGFFYLRGHGVPQSLFDAIEAAARRFFALPAEQKAGIAMARGGLAWRGWFAVGEELTSGMPDRKEGIYFGSELGPDHPRVRAGWPLHGANLWPESVPELRPAVLAYMAATARAAQALMRGVSLSLGLAADYFAQTYTAEPTILFRIFNYPGQPPDAASAAAAAGWGVGEHTDYGLLTLLAQDASGGLQVKMPAGWIDAPPLPGSFVCNIGDMLDRLTGGLYRSTPHRVLNRGTSDRLSFPLFFDPDFAAEMRPLPARAGVDAGEIAADRARRWDGSSVHDFSGTYGAYVMNKVAKVFPQLGDAVRLTDFRD